MSQNPLNAKGLEAAYAAYEATGISYDAMGITAAIRAYLASQEAAAPSEAMRDELLAADAADPEATFDNGADMLDWLNAPAAAPSGKITEAELVAMFGDAMPIEAAELLWKCPPDWTTDRLRSELRALASPAVAPVADAKQKIIEFAQAILHGDDEHRGWLMGAALAFNAGDELPAPRGKGTAPVAPVAVSVKGPNIYGEVDEFVIHWPGEVTISIAKDETGYAYKKDGKFVAGKYSIFDEPVQAAEEISAALSSIIPATKGEDPFEICAKVAEGHADVVEEMRGIYPGDPQGALGRDASKMRKLAKAIRALRPAALSAQDTDGVAK